MKERLPQVAFTLSESFKHQVKSVKSKVTKTRHVSPCFFIVNFEELIISFKISVFETVIDRLDTYLEGFRSRYTGLGAQTQCQKSFLIQYILSSIHSDK